MPVWDVFIVSVRACVHACVVQTCYATVHICCSRPAKDRRRLSPEKRSNDDKSDSIRSDNRRTRKLHPAYTRFEDEYWKANFDEPETMDCIGNATEHVKYIKAFFDIESMDINSIVEVGFGLGHLLGEMIRILEPEVVHGLEPSSYAYARGKTHLLRCWRDRGDCGEQQMQPKLVSIRRFVSSKTKKIPAGSTSEEKTRHAIPFEQVCSCILRYADKKMCQLDLERTDALKWANGSCSVGYRSNISFERKDNDCPVRCRRPTRAEWEPQNEEGKSVGENEAVYHLGVCTSVLQYLPDSELEDFIQRLSKRVYYLYLTVPTTKEYARQVDELDFHDKYALRRSRKFYQNLLSKYFTFISSRILESREFFTEDTTPFTDLVFRF